MTIGKHGALKVHAIRLKPGDDLRDELERFTKENDIQDGFIITAVGSLQYASLRLANQLIISNFEGKFEIVSLVGTLSRDGVHLHVAVADETGKTLGGHVMANCEIYTTAEVIIGEAIELHFSRETDDQTGYRELVINPKLER